MLRCGRLPGGRCAVDLVQLGDQLQLDRGDAGDLGGQLGRHRGRHRQHGRGPDARAHRRGGVGGARHELVGDLLGPEARELRAQGREVPYGNRGAISMIRSARYARPAPALSPPLRTPSLTACIRRPTAVGTPWGWRPTAPPGRPGRHGERAPHWRSPGSPARRHAPMEASCGPVVPPTCGRRRFQGGVEPVTADPPQSQSRQIG